jgi:hypothetical protein
LNSLDAKMCLRKGRGITNIESEAFGISYQSEGVGGEGSRYGEGGMSGCRSLVVGMKGYGSGFCMG